MSRRNYYGLPGGTRNPFGSTGKKPRPLVLPPLPSTAGLLLSLMQHASREHRTTAAQPWGSPFGCWATSALGTYYDARDAYQAHTA